MTGILSIVDAPEGGEVVVELPNDEIGSRRKRIAEMRERLGSSTEPQKHESLVRFVYANLAIEDPSVTLQEVREVLSRDATER